MSSSERLYLQQWRRMGVRLCVLVAACGAALATTAGSARGQAARFLPDAPGSLALPRMHFGCCADGDSFSTPVRAPLTPQKSGEPQADRQGEQEQDRGEGYQWRGLIWQTVEFNLAENGFRVASDSTMRDLLAHKPFWHDFLSSMQQWNLRRWSDGDDFLVDDVGHPMQGAVSAYIEMQNSPSDSRIEWGDPGYLQSRFKGFLWATMFSTNEKIGPTGEAGVGNDGGFTYGNNCDYHCTSADFGPGTGYTKYTNNTGWTDLVITPTVGMLWVLAEDVLDKDVSDRLTTAYPEAQWVKVVRGGLNPTRTFANALRWRTPWYRDFQQSRVEEPRVAFFPSDEQAAWSRVPRFSIAPYWSSFSIAANTPGCFNCRRTALGTGLEASAHIRGWLSFDSVMSYHPNASPLPSDRAGGNMTVAAFGLSGRKDWRYWSAHAAVRPGMVRFSQAYLYSPVTFVVPVTPTDIGTIASAPPTMPEPGVIDANGTPLEPKLGTINHFLWDVNVGVDYKLTNRLAIRMSVDEDLVRYRTDKVDPDGIGAPPYLSWLSKQNFINRGNHSYQLGPVFSF